MANKSHLKFLSEKQLSEVESFRYNYGPISQDDEEILTKNYSRQALSFRVDLQKFNSDLKKKYRDRDVTLEVPYDIDYIKIRFQGVFAIKDTWQKYYNDFGLEPTSFYDFGKIGLFAISDRDKFKRFFTDIANFVSRELQEDGNVEYSDYVKYVASFELLNVGDILKFGLENMGDIVYLSLMNLPLEIGVKQQIVASLIAYLRLNFIEFTYEVGSDRIELQAPSSEQIQKIAENFDIIESITCSVFTTVRPGEFNIVQREFGFNISNLEENLPIVGIIDTGISQQTALAPLIINDNTFTLIGDPLIDIAGRSRLGHGTAVAGLVALGKNNHRNNFAGDVSADARVLSIKISENGSGYISEIDLLKMLYDVKIKYPEIRLFTLTTCYGNYLLKNEGFSDYTYSLDKFAYETKSLVFICTGNNDNCIFENTKYDLSYFKSDNTNLSTPADSLNNITIGAAADNLGEDAFLGASDGREFPALYTRKGHIDLSEVYNQNKTNKNYFKPDVIESGGDIGYNRENGLDYMDKPALTLLSARREMGLMQEIGTSFATPLVANLAARIVKNYPSLTNESVKALIVNGASLDFIPFPSDLSKLRNRVVGNGLVDDFRSLFSDENSATLILEDVIENGKIRVYPINFPKYLIEDDLGKKRGILKVTATLCFSFLPIKNNQLSYNPIHMAFSVFKNHSALDIMKSEQKLSSKLKTNLSWSENGRYVSKPLPYSNTQKVSFNINVSDLINENNTFKLAIHAKLSEQVVGGLPKGYPNEFPFSIVLTLEENLKNKTGKLYDEVQLVNDVEAVQSVNLETGLEVEALDV